MPLYDKWGVKTGFTFVLQFFMLLISDSLGGVIVQKKHPYFTPSRSLGDICKCKKLFHNSFFHKLYKNALHFYPHDMTRRILNSMTSVVDYQLWADTSGDKKWAHFYKIKWF